MESTRFSLNAVDIKKILVHLAVYGVGFGAIAVFTEIAKLDFGAYTQVVGLATGFVIDAIRKYLQGK